MNPVFGKLIGRAWPLVFVIGTSACDYGPPVEGGQPQLVYEDFTIGGRLVGGRLATTHYYEAQPASLAHPRELQAFFRFRCQETYLTTPCTILLWPIGMAPRRGGPLFRSEKAAEAAYYFFDRRTGYETFWAKSHPRVVSGNS